LCGCGEAEAEKEGTVLPKGRAFYVDRVVVLAYEAGPFFVLLLTALDGRRDQCFVRLHAERDQSRTTLLEGVVDDLPALLVRVAATVADGGDAILDLTLIQARPEPEVPTVLPEQLFVPDHQEP